MVFSFHIGESNFSLSNMYEGHGENVRLILKTGDLNQALPQQSGYPTLSKAGKQGRLKLGFAQKVPTY